MLSNQSSKPKTYCRFVSAKIEIISKEDLICCQLPWIIPRIFDVNQVSFPSDGMISPNIIFLNSKLFLSPFLAGNVFFAYLCPHIHIPQKLQTIKTWIRIFCLQWLPWQVRYVVMPSYNQRLQSGTTVLLTRWTAFPCTPISSLLSQLTRHWKAKRSIRTIIFHSKATGNSIGLLMPMNVRPTSISLLSTMPHGARWVCRGAGKLMVMAILYT